ncbi:MAG: ECF transporter S component [Ardenticatenales bacterium]|nr:ECF transporter S component [Ardenticatenales bacterium]
MRSTFNTLTLALMPIAIVLNITIGALISYFNRISPVIKIPLYLDSIGTILAGVLAGPVAGGLTGALSNILWSFILADPVIIWFAPVAFVIGVLAGLFGYYSWMRKIQMALLGGLVTGIVAAVMSAPIATYVYGGITGGGTDFLVAAFQSFMDSTLGAVAAQGIFSDPPDKMISYLLVFLILKGLPRRLLVRFPQGEKTASPHRRPLIGHVD